MRIVQSPNATTWQIKPSMLWSLPGSSTLSPTSPPHAPWASATHSFLWVSWVLCTFTCYFSAWNTFFSFCALKNLNSFFKLQFKRLLLCEAFFYPLQLQIWSHPSCSSPMLILLLLSVLSHLVTIVDFHIHPLASLLLITCYRLQRTGAMTCSCLSLNTICGHSCPHPVCKQLLSAWYVWGITLGTEFTAGRGHSLDCAENGVCMMRLESNSQGSVSRRPCQPWQRSGDFFSKATGTHWKVEVET